MFEGDVLRCQCVLQTWPNKEQNWNLNKSIPNPGFWCTLKQAKPYRASPRILTDKRGGLRLSPNQGAKLLTAQLYLQFQIT